MPLPEQGGRQRAQSRAEVARQLAGHVASPRLTSAMMPAAGQPGASVTGSRKSCLVPMISRTIRRRTWGQQAAAARRVRAGLIPPLTTQAIAGLVHIILRDP
jgi:hypothetical protein